tara:strand:+ start:323 stop:808 length:486 start_codon:yes stop_codon:yes gene_type:complete
MAKHILRYIYNKDKTMAKKIKLTEGKLVSMIEKLVEQETGIESAEVLRALDDAQMLRRSGDEKTSSDIEDLKLGLSGAEEELGAVMSPEQIMGLQSDQIDQLQDRVNYMEELNADVLEFIQYLMSDLRKTEDIDLRKSSQKLRVLETRSGRDMFWLKSRRL